MTPDAIARTIARAIAHMGHAPPRWLLVDVARQRLWLLHGRDPVADWPVSTGAAGVGTRAG